MSTNPSDHVEHLLSFVDAFIVSERKPRWRELLSKRGKSAFNNSAKLMGALDPRFCKRIDDIGALDLPAQGVFYDFCSEPRVATLQDAMKDVGDSIIVIERSSLALHFSHEGWVWLCVRDKA